jgi:hypothetical protein
MFRPVNDGHRASNKKSRRKVKYNANIFTVWDHMNSQNCLFSELYKTQKYSQWKNVKILIFNEVLYIFMLCFVDRASLYNLVNKTKLVHNFSLYALFAFCTCFGRYVPIIRRI